MPHQRDLRDDLERGLQIDRNDLDTSVSRHPDLVYRVATELTLAVSRRDAAKQALAEVEAEVDAELREDLAGERVTETNIASQKALDSRVQSAKGRLLELTIEAGLWNALREAYKERSYNLTAMVDLYVAGYFADRSEGRAASNVRDHKSQIARVRMHEARKEYGVTP